MNQQLGGVYARWFAELDALVHLRVPGWSQVRSWRAQQERETAARNQGRSALQDESARERFLRHYQRLSLHALQVMPGQADAVLELSPEHEVSSIRLAKALDRR